ncbi:MAG TPA: MaoC family dehydratase N-terminal domain-containing protein [Burkholderiaceae bacterium]|nr:MaoC family dehydratase N-terminal domain-containing protein [Burkholderiaceae bacterium]
MHDADAANEVDRRFIGTATEPWTVGVERGAIRAFAAAIGDEQSLYVDEAHARGPGLAQRDRAADLRGHLSTAVAAALAGGIG